MRQKCNKNQIGINNTKTEKSKRGKDYNNRDQSNSRNKENSESVNRLRDRPNKLNRNLDCNNRDKDCKRRED